MSNKLFVGNLDWGVTSDELRELFSQFGEIEDAVVLVDRHTNRSRGFGFVTFKNAEDAGKAMGELNEKDFKGRPLVVNEARPQQPREERSAGQY
jgi:RNA recognition motif-containing protein